METGSLSELETWFSRIRGRVRYQQLYIGSIFHEKFSFWHDLEGDTDKPESTFVKGVSDAKKRLKTLKNCLLCEHRRKEKYGRGSLYCTERRRAFPSNNEAVQCEKFKCKLS